jgi:hypothetical protein
MPEVSADQRQKAKTTAANAAVALNDTAVVLGVAGVVVAAGGVASGVGALAGVGVGATLAVFSFGAWWIGNRYQRLANDPPRSDFDQVTISSASLVENVLPAGEPDATVARFAATQLIIVDALSALVTSLERYDGATGASDASAASSQATAVQQNAQSAAGALDTLAELANALNQAWNATLPTVDWSSVALQQAQEAFQEDVGDPAQAPAAALQQVFGTVTGLAAADDGIAELDLASHPLLTATAMPSEPSTLIDADTIGMLGTLSATLRDLVVVDAA